MSKKIKFSFLKVLFRLFSFLADKTNGAKIFAKPKILIGTLLLGGVVIASNQKVYAQSVKCYKPAAPPIENIAPDTNKVYDFVEQMPQFIGGQKALMKWLNENINFPMIMCYDGGMQSGKVYVRFIVRKTGEIDNIEIKKSANSILDKEAIRVVQSMPKWQVGKQNGVEVDVYYILPISISLK